MVILHIKIKRITNPDMVANILPKNPLPPIPPTPPWIWGQKVEIQLFQNMVMLHIKLKGITKCSNMVAIILPADTDLSPRQGMGSIGQKSFFSEHGHVAYQIKGNHEMKQHSRKYFACRSPSTLTLGDGVKRSKLNFSKNNGHVAYQIKGNHECSNMIENILPAYPTPPLILGLGPKDQNSTD